MGDAAMNNGKTDKRKTAREARKQEKVGATKTETPSADLSAAPSAPAPSFATASKQTDTHSIVLSSINGRSLTDFATYMLNANHQASLRAFSEKKDLGFTVSIQNKPGQEPCFIINIPKGKDDRIDETTLNLARLAIGKMRKFKEQDNSIKLASVRTLLDDFIKEQKEKSDQKLGDRIVTVFAELSRGKPAASENADARAPAIIKTEKNSTDTPSSPHLILSDHFNCFSCPINFVLSQFNDDGQMFHTRADGSQKIFEPTKNQWSLINAIRDPDVKAVLCQAPTGAGKTFWTTYIALELLKHGIVKEIGYERPPVTVGDHYNPYLKGDMNDKFSPYADVLENAFAKHLGAGDPKAGKSILTNLQKSGVLTRYDQLYKAGDNLEFKLVLADESQIKDRAEIFHLLTRPADGGKIILSGDGEDQDYMKKRKSGFLQALDLFGNEEMRNKALESLRGYGIEVDPKSIAVIKMGPEDIKRSPYTAFVYEMYKQMDRLAAQKTDAAPQKNPASKKPQCG